MSLMMLSIAVLCLQLLHSEGALRSARRSLSLGEQPADGTMNYVDRYIGHLGSDAELKALSSAMASPGPMTSNTTERRHVVVAKYDEDVAWLRQLPANYEVVIYQSKDPATPNYVENFGNEASKYLRYIVDTYDNLPDSMIFVQAGQQDWHDPLPKEMTLTSWDWNAIGNFGGLLSLPTSAPCLIEDAVNGSAGAARKQPAHPGCNGVVEHVPKQMAALKEAWPDVFEDELGTLPTRWLTHCCAQFEVTREAVQQHPKDFYNRLFHWLMQHDQQLLEADTDGAIRRNHDPQRKDSGHIMEVAWVLLFQLDQAIYLPEPAGNEESL